MPLNINLQQILLHALNFVILFGAMYFLLYKPVKSFMDSRKAHYEKMDEDAKAVLAEAEKTKAGYEAQLKSADEEIARRQRCHGGNARAGDLPRQGQPLDHRKPDAQPGKAAGAAGHAQQVDVLHRKPAGTQRGVDHGQQGLAVGHAVVALGLVQQGVVPQNGYGGGLACGIYSQDIHTITYTLCNKIYKINQS